MDAVLTKAEKKELMSLLSLNAACYGNLPLMQQKYKKAALKFHPDKGGDEEKMKRLNTLFSKVYQNLSDLRDQPRSSSSQDIPTYGTREWEQWWEEFNRTHEDDLYCSENLDSSDDEYQPPKRKKGPKTSTPPSSPPPSGDHPPASPPPSPVSSPKSPASSASGWSPPASNPPSPDSEAPPKKKRRDSPDPSQQSFSTPPKQKKMDSPEDFPEILRPFLSNAVFSNKTVSAFLIYTTKEKGMVLVDNLDKFDPNYRGCFKYNDYSIVFLLTPGKHRVTAVTNYCKQFCTVSFIMVKAIIKLLDCYDTLNKEPFSIMMENPPYGLHSYQFQDPVEKPSPGVNWVQLSDFAIKIKCEDPLLLMGFYLDFSTPPGACKKCNARSIKMHYQNHEKEHKNALLFKECKSQKTACQQACDAYVASKRLKILESSRSDLLLESMQEVLEKMEEVLAGPVTFMEYMAGVAWLSCLMPDFDEVITRIIQYMVENTPKRRYVCFKGPINSGKTTVAAALLDLLGGKTLNINCPQDKLAFELGCAIDQFMVVFEDVKGQAGDNKDLTPGQGIHNLDNLRDHLDGSVKVNLEKKHVNKKSQIFPPGIVTMNDYFIPPTLQARFVLTINFRPKLYLRKSLEKNLRLLQSRIPQSGITMMLLLIWWQPVATFAEEIQEKVVYWKETLCKYVPYTTFMDMKHNILQGEDPLKGIVFEVDEDEEELQQTEDSGVVA
ncbi:large T antigen [Deltapolyomavirus canis]|uniref:Large T antigen n=1 Tax=Deltapolyomavirus canis TaxID=2170403 RepID=A0A2S1CJS5_9POLY|nr:large T antigen [Deltapolyomavirus canis]AWD33791.1 large T antigen [Deltapolyomavirus canis]AWD33795.1 large T antigen [Deltapolyomavirus canis]